MQKTILIITIFLLQIIILEASSVKMTVEDMEAESVEGIAPASIEMEEEMRQGLEEIDRSKGSDLDNEEPILEMVNGEMKIKIDNDEKSEIEGEDDVEPASEEI